MQCNKKSTAFVYYCNCREELKSKKPRIAEILNRRDTLPRINRYACGGTIRINIDRSCNLAIVGIYHYIHPPPEAMEVSSQIRDYIINNSLLTVPQLYNNIKEQQLDGFSHITQHQVYYWFKKVTTKEYMFSGDQLASARQYLENNYQFKLLFQDQNSLAFLTPLLFVLPNKVTKTI
ncbi:7268_t:CDS:1, partial [Racocetra persica]